MIGYIKLHRKLLEGYCFANPITLKIWVWMLCRANFKDNFVPVKIGGGSSVVEVKEGQFIFGRLAAQEELNIKATTIYKQVKKLEKEGMISLKSNNHYTLVTIVNWEIYQGEDKKSNNHVTTTEQPNDNHVTTEGQPRDTVKKDKKDNNVKKDIGERKLDFINSLKDFIPKYGSPMVDDFFRYWSELNPSKTKMKFELQKTWEISLRLKTWEARSNGFNKKTEVIAKPAYLAPIKLDFDGNL